VFAQCMGEVLTRRTSSIVVEGDERCWTRERCRGAIHAANHATEIA
jgi:hypothetical protein